MKYRISFLMCLMSTVLFSADPEVENVRFEQRIDGTLLVDIYYDAADADGDTLSVDVEASSDSGATWVLPCSTLTGDVGDGVLPGTDKHVVWDFFADNPEVSGSGYQIKITADDRDIWVYVEGGTFEMGSDRGESNEQPVHPVVIDSFRISRYEVTNIQYCSFLNNIDISRSGYVQGVYFFDMNESQIEWSDIENSYVPQAGKDIYPVGGVTWAGAEAYADWAGGRLPTEAEWEFAARGGNKIGGFIYSGSDTLDNVGWYSDNSANPDNPMIGEKGTHPVGTRQANELGIYDMSGNVWEWCQDWYGLYGNGLMYNPTGPATGPGRVMRGGCCFENSRGCRVTYRSYYRPPTAKVYGYHGFRVVRPANDSDGLTGQLIDQDGNMYQTVKIGDQWWMAENLKVTHFRNGDNIPHVTDGAEWYEHATAAYCAYDNNENLAEIYGYIYNRLVIFDPREIAPKGWHVPTDEDWQELEMYLGMPPHIANKGGWRGTDEGGKMKETGTTHWDSPNTDATNESGFTALPSGCRQGGNGRFYGIGWNTWFWTSSSNEGNILWARYLCKGYSEIARYGCDEQLRYGFPIRLVKD